jgi:hypothetical protein
MGRTDMGASQRATLGVVMVYDALYIMYNDGR